MGNPSFLRSGVVLLLVAAGTWHCKGRGNHGQAGADSLARDTAGVAGEAEKSLVVYRRDTLADGTVAVVDSRTVIKPAAGFGKKNRELTFDGEGTLHIPAGKPMVIRTRQLVINLLSPDGRIHFDAFASSPGEQADLLNGKVRVKKSYHSSTDNEPETLQPGDMVMINIGIDLMEKEKLNAAELKTLELKFPPLTPGTAPAQAGRGSAPGPAPVSGAKGGGAAQGGGHK